MLFPAAMLALLPAIFATPTPYKSAPLHKPRSATSIIPGKYIVKFRDDTADVSLNAVLASHKPDRIYSSPGFRGFAGSLDSASLDSIRSLSEVEFIEQDSLVTTHGTVSRPNPPWNLARLSSRTPGSTTYRYDDSAGAGTCVYVVDTGVDTSQPELEGRVVWGVNTVDNTTTDGNGHGTAVAGVVGAVTRGVAGRTRIVAVKVLGDGGAGALSGVISGLNFVASDSRTRSGCANGTVANISLGGSRSVSLNAAAAALVRAGVFITVAAGGSGDDVQYYSPASEPLVFTVGSTNVADERSAYSNYGGGVDLWAPGEGVEVVWGEGTNTLSGTSFSAAHAAGLGAYLLGLKPNLSPEELGDYIQSIATRDVVKGLQPGTKNLLAYNGIDL